MAFVRTVRTTSSLNGVDNNVNVIDFLNQTSYVIGPSVEAIGEMRIMTNGYNAEYGRGAGGVVNVDDQSRARMRCMAPCLSILQNAGANANRWENNRNGVKKGASARISSARPSAVRSSRTALSGSPTIRVREYFRWRCGPEPGYLSLLLDSRSCIQEWDFSALAWQRRSEPIRSDAHSRRSNLRSDQHSEL